MTVAFPALDGDDGEKLRGGAAADESSGGADDGPPEPAAGVGVEGGAGRAEEGEQGTRAAGAGRGDHHRDGDGAGDHDGRDDRHGDDDDDRGGDDDDYDSDGGGGGSPSAGAASLDAEVRELSQEEAVAEWLDAARYDDLGVLRAILRVRGGGGNDGPSTPSSASSQAPAAAAVSVVDWSDPRGNTALHMAAANGHGRVVRWLLRRGAAAAPSNESGNTPLHWAAANGRDAVVGILLGHGSKEKESSKARPSRQRREAAAADGSGTADGREVAVGAEGSAEGSDAGGGTGDGSGIDVLQRNKFGRSALTEGFQSDNAEVIRRLLEHPSASEERLLLPSATTTSGPRDGDDDGVEGAEAPSTSSAIHDLVLGGGGARGVDGDDNVEPPSAVEVRAREVAMALDEKQSIVGQDRPDDDRTGLGVWSSSVVAAHWMARIPLLPHNGDGAAVAAGAQVTALELGAGCAVPSLVLARRLAASEGLEATAGPKPPRRHAVYAGDWNAEAVDNIRYNLRLNGLSDGDPACACHAIRMDWKDRRTWGPWAPSSAPVVAGEREKSPNAAARNPPRKPSIIVGADLIYETSMVQPLVSVVAALLDEESPSSRFYYVAPVAPRQGGKELVRKLLETFRLVSSSLASSELRRNPLRSQDDDECFLHFQELLTTDFRLYEFAWR